VCVITEAGVRALDRDTFGPVLAACGVRAWQREVERTESDEITRGTRETAPRPAEGADREKQQHLEENRKSAHAPLSVREADVDLVHR